MFECYKNTCQKCYCYLNTENCCLKTMTKQALNIRMLEMLKRLARTKRLPRQLEIMVLKLQLDRMVRLS